MRLLFIFLFCLFSSCSIQKEYAHDNKISLLKEFAFCKCIENATKIFHVLDSAEAYSGEVVTMMDANGLFSSKVEPALDSLISTAVIANQLLRRNSSDKLISRDTRRLTTYTVACVNFYKSPTLDSFLKNLPKEHYTVR
jgi:hypothetical protein